MLDSSGESFSRGLNLSLPCPGPSTEACLQKQHARHARGCIVPSLLHETSRLKAAWNIFHTTTVNTHTSLSPPSRPGKQWSFRYIQISTLTPPPGSKHRVVGAEQPFRGLSGPLSLLFASVYSACRRPRDGPCEPYADGSTVGFILSRTATLAHAPASPCSCQLSLSIAPGSPNTGPCSRVVVA